MVVEERSRTTRKTKESQPNLPSPTPLIKKIASLQRKPDKDKALEMLHRVAVSIAPIMRENNLKVGLLCEMFPKKQELLGLNVNRGQKVLIRLRDHWNDRKFLSFGDILGTALHELVHNTHGPHNKAFYDKLEQFKQRYHQISMKSAYETTGYFAEAEKLGGRATRNENQSRINRLKPTKSYKSEVRKLGTNDNNNDKDKRSAAGPKKSLRELVAEAAQRRLQDNMWCAEEAAHKEEYEPEDSELEIEVVKEIIISTEENRGYVIKKEEGMTQAMSVKEDRKQIIDLDYESDTETPVRKKLKKKKVDPLDSVEIIDLT
ncbi:metalloendopeptidase [Saccharomycopsis crataegensis]|uniref:Metalloendopeptidase n=1 Tax=Saccharomycopsis crataegensis TaxID=43959 RepID=A0AAV5QK41_9ASCO|nr:metalloendopeptidase [Saccharomycopsis crataegensis]